MRVKFIYFFPGKLRSVWSFHIHLSIFNSSTKDWSCFGLKISGNILLILFFLQVQFVVAVFWWKISFDLWDIFLLFWTVFFFKLSYLFLICVHVKLRPNEVFGICLDIANGLFQIPYNCPKGVGFLWALFGSYSLIECIVELPGKIIKLSLSGLIHNSHYAGDSIMLICLQHSGLWDEANFILRSQGLGL